MESTNSESTRAFEHTNTRLHHVIFREGQPVRRGDNRIRRPKSLAVSEVLGLPRSLLPSFGRRKFDAIPAFFLGSVHAQVSFVDKVGHWALAI